MQGNETKLLRVLAAGDETGILDLYEEVFRCDNRSFQSDIAFAATVCPLKTVAIEKVQEAIVQNNPIAVCLIHLPQEGEAIAIESAAGIQRIDPSVNFVILSETSANVAGIKRRILPAAKLLFVRKPFYPEEILQLTEVMGAMWQAQKDLQRVSSEMRVVSRELMETNEALSVLARNLESSRRESENRIILRIRTLIMPIIQKLRSEKGLKRFKTDVELLNAYIESLTSDLSSDLKTAAMLSRTEQLVASMVKNGMTSDEIASHLNISLLTVKSHRKHIRRKLDIQNSGVNLRSYLESDLKEA